MGIFAVTSFTPVVVSAYVSFPCHFACGSEHDIHHRALAVFTVFFALSASLVVLVGLGMYCSMTSFQYKANFFVQPSVSPSSF